MLPLEGVNVFQQPQESQSIRRRQAIAPQSGNPLLLARDMQFAVSNMPLRHADVLVEKHRAERETTLAVPYPARREGNVASGSIS
jgi:hypothetical protein